MRIIDDTLALKWVRGEDSRSMEYAFEATGRLLFEMAPGDMLTTARVYEAIAQNDDMAEVAGMIKLRQVEWGVRFLGEREQFDIELVKNIAVDGIALVEVFWESTSDIPEREVRSDDEPEWERRERAA